jgi:2-oxoglutarate dehydrogenase E2 component (dihydrolipoamide succinyltransferase)
MAKTDIIMPQMGESIAEGTITKWLKSPGDSVRRDEPLFEISTDKVDAEIPSPTAGVLAEIKVGEGETVEVNSIVGTIADSMEEAAAGDGGGDASAAAAPAAEPVAAPSAATAPPAAPAAAPAAPTQPAAAPSPSAGGPPAFPSARGVENKEELQRTRSTPVVRRMAQEHGVDISAIVGTGVSGRVTKQDLLAYIEAGGPAVTPSPAAPLAPVTAPAPLTAAPQVLPAVPAFQPGEAVTVEAMSVMRKKIAEHMVLSKRTAAHVQTIFEIDCSNVIKTRKALQDDFVGRHGQKLTITPFFVKAAVEALRALPIVNASLDGDNIVYKRDINVGVAVALEWGLIVPVIHNADDLSLVGINRRVADLAERARTKQLKPEEVQGGTFTITNPGVFGSLFGTPIINQPQVAILGMGTIEKRVKVVENDAIIVKPMMFTCLSFDHRIIDGAVADQFMGHLKKTLETADFKALL